MKVSVYIFCCVLIFLLLCGCDANNAQNETTISYTVQNETVEQEEIDYFTTKNKTNVMGKFITEYKAEFDEDFWTTEYDGITPQEYLDGIVKEESIKAKIQLILCREHGIYTDISYSGLYDKAIEYNKTHENSQSVGLTSIPLDSFYDYYLDNGIMELKNILETDKLAPNEEELNEKLKEVKEKYPDKDETEQISIAKDIITEEKYDKYIEELYNAYLEESKAP